MQGGFQNTAIALTSFLPDIIRIVSGVVLGRMLLGGRGMGAARGVATGGGRGGLLPMLLAGGGLLAAGTALGSRGSGDQRRMELTRRQAIPQLLSRNDVKRFRASSARFDDILTGISDKKNIRINPLVGNDVVDDIEEPKGFVDVVSDLGGGISNFFGGDDEDIEKEDSIENIDPKEKNNIFSMEDYENEMKSDFADIFGKDKLINLLPDDEIGIINSNNILTTEGGDSTNNIITIGSEDKQVSTGTDTPPTNSNVHVKSTFSDNSKISYILEYGGGAVIG